MKQIVIISFLFLFNITGYTQSFISGVVTEIDEEGKKQPIIGASVYYIGSPIGVLTDSIGSFTLPYDSSFSKIGIASYGYNGDTIEIKQLEKMEIQLSPFGKQLQELEIEGKRDATALDFNSMYNTKVMGEKELFKAACCNLSESFETNPSVDVNYADAVTGAKQIQLLGLSGIYTQLTSENLPGTRGLASNFGLSYTPGTWIESIQVAKGIGSVVNGYESITGQLNIELKKPEESEKIYLNGYLNSMARSEGNLILATKLSKKVSTSLLTHADFWGTKLDMNKDGFMDMPLSNQYSFINRWKYQSNKGLEAQAGVKVLYDDRTGGQMNFNKKEDKFTTNQYGIGIQAKRFEGFSKIGYVWQAKPYKSVGLILDVLQHESTNYFGLTSYNGKQQSIYGNLIYHSIIKNSNHKFKTGLSYLYDKYDENLNLMNYKRTEIVPGAFVEYSFTHKERFSLVAGFRTDYNSLFGLIYTPRLHAKYNLTENTTIRLATGRGQRTANIFAENMAYLATSRIPIIIGSPSIRGYGLNPEIAWNYGLNLLHEFKINTHKGSLNLDYYRTDFINQTVVDLDLSPQVVTYSDLKGVSYSNSVQAEINYELIKRFDVRMAYRFYDVKTTYHGVLLEKFLLSKHRAFINLAYETKNKWAFDYTISWNGPKRIPTTESNPIEYRKEAYSPSYVMMNTQVTKKFGKVFDAYLGVENLTNYRQKDLIVANNEPFGPYFDSSLIWGPVLGRMYYIGFRLKIK